MIDTHTHIYGTQFEDIDLVVKRALEAGVEKMLLPGVDSSSYDSMIALAQRYPNNCLAMMGLHPTSVNDNPDFRAELAVVENYLKNPPLKFWAIGEAGLDLYWSRDFLSEQIEALRFQLELSIEYSLPIVLHTRDAFDEMIAVLSDYKGVKGVFHSFCGTEQQYETMRELGDFKFGIGGVVTYKRSAVAEVVPAMSLEDIVLETDAPYLTPVPYRGKRNECSYLLFIAAKIADLKGVDQREVEETTTRNAIKLFSL